MFQMRNHLWLAASFNAGWNLTLTYKVPFQSHEFEIMFFLSIFISIVRFHKLRHLYVHSAQAAWSLCWNLGLSSSTFSLANANLPKVHQPAWHNCRVFMATYFCQIWSPKETWASNFVCLTTTNLPKPTRHNCHASKVRWKFKCVLSHLAQCDVYPTPRNALFVRWFVRNVFYPI